MILALSLAIVRFIQIYIKHSNSLIANYSITTIIEKYLQGIIYTMASYVRVREISLGLISFLQVFVGTFGNIISFIILFRCRKQHVMIAQYLCVLSIVDLIYVVCIGFFEEVLMFDWPSLSGWERINVYNTNNFLCKFRYAVEGCFTASGWIIATFSIERAIAIRAPFAAQKFYTPFRRMIIISFVILISLLMGIIKGSYRSVKSTGWCDYTGASQTAVLKYANEVIYMAFMAVIPCLIVFICNILIITGVSNADKALKKTSKNSEQSRKLRINLLLVSTVYCICVLPFISMWIFLNYISYIASDPDEITMKIYHFVDDDLYYYIYRLVMCNYCTNFIIYASTLDFYRVEIKKIMGKIIR